MPNDGPIDFRISAKPKPKYTLVGWSVATFATILCACQQYTLVLEKAGVDKSCPVCGRKYVVAKLEYNVQAIGPHGEPAGVALGIIMIEPTIVRPGA